MDRCHRLPHTRGFLRQQGRCSMFSDWVQYILTGSIYIYIFLSLLFELCVQVVGDVVILPHAERPLSCYCRAASISSGLTRSINKYHVASLVLGVMLLATHCKKHKYFEAFSRPNNTRNYGEEEWILGTNLRKQPHNVGGIRKPFSVETAASSSPVSARDWKQNTSCFEKKIKRESDKKEQTEAECRLACMMALLACL